MIKVSIADDHLMVIRGLQTMLGEFPQIEVIATYTNGKDLLKGLKKQQPDVLLLDIHMPGMNGDELAQIISGTYPRVSILTITNMDQTFHVQSMLHNGALGYLLKSAGPDILEEAIKMVYKGKQFIDPALKEQLLADMLVTKKGGAKEEAEPLPTLTRREKEILTLLAQEFTSVEIADKLFIGNRTVENYRFNLLLKLKVKNTVGLVKKAIKYGLVE